MWNGPFTMIEDAVRNIDPSIEVYRCEYEGSRLKRVVIRFPADGGIHLMQRFTQAGWKPEHQEVRGTPERVGPGIKGWIPAAEGRMYLRMSAVAGECTLPGVSQQANP